MSTKIEDKFSFYYLGLDIGTNSVGWAVTDESYQILRHHGQDMWGVHLFEEAKTAAERRGYRTARRRNDRVKTRMRLLRNLMSDEILRIDPNFFMRLKESFLYRSDRTADKYGVRTKYTLFDDLKFRDSDYHKKYPTVYHLRHELMQPWKESHDIRLVYLAVAHILKSRGNFLYQGASFETGNAFEQIYAELENAAKNCGIELPYAEHKNIKDALMQKGIKRKKEGLTQLYQAKGNKPLTELIAMLSGGTPKVNDLFSCDDSEVDYKSLFDEDDALKKFSLDKPDFEEKVLPALESVLEDAQYQLMVSAKKLYDWNVLCHILGEHKTLSESMIEQHQKHHTQVAQLKRLIKQYCPDQYEPFFWDNTKNDNYIAWIGKGSFKNNSSQCNLEEFEKALKNLLKKIPDTDAKKKQILDDLDVHEFLPKLRTGSNGVIPYQLHLNELRTILKNAASFYPFLNHVDDSGFTVMQKIEMLLTFRIPYYVGPLNDKHLAEKDPLHGHAWIVRHKGFEHTPIRPWNFDRVVDREACAEAFIRRMTNKCTYLPTCDTIPKESLLYSEFIVLNQLNNLKIKGKTIDRESKKILFDLCKKQKNVSKRDILKRLSVNNADDLSGFDGDLKLSLKSYHDFKSILGESAMQCDNVREFAEESILACTIFNESTDDLLKNRIRKSAIKYGLDLTDKQIQKIASLHYKDWGNFSREFLTLIDGYSRKTGECYSIIQALREETDNLMQLLSDRKYAFSENIRKYNDDHRSQVHGFTYNALVRPLHCSPAIKRSIWRSLVIVKDIIRVTHNTPARIFVEMARDDAKKKLAQKGKRTVSRRDQLLEKYRQIKSDPEIHAELIDQLNNKSDDDLRRAKDKLYLYFSQNGRCMYSGEPIDLDHLLGDRSNNIWDIDHIYPQSKVMDNSLDNRVLVKRELNHRKQDQLPIPSGVVQPEAKQLWKWLLKHELISQEKYNRLTRNNNLSADELAGFISRQLVETRQTTKLVCEILREAFEKQGTRIVYSHAGCVSEFRNAHINPERNQLEMVKCREVNDFHHAKDAYLNIVVGNVFYTRFTQRPADIFGSGEHVNVQYYTENKTGLLQNRISRYDPILKRDICAWLPGKSIATVRKNVGGTRILVTRMTYETKGGFYDQQILKASKDYKTAKIPIKSATTCLWDYTRYGGYDNEKGAYFFLVEYSDKKKRLRAFRHVPVRLAEAIRHDPNRLLKYCTDSEPLGLNLKEPKILIRKVLFNTRFVFDGFPFTINGRTGTAFLIRHCVQLVLSAELTRYLKIVLKSAEDKQLCPDVTSEDNLKLYEAFLNKHKNPIYSKRPSPQIKTIENGFSKFRILDLNNQCTVLKNILTIFTCSTGGVSDLSLIGGAKNAGSMNKSMNLDNYKTAFIEYPSPTGLTCERIDLKKLK